MELWTRRLLADAAANVPAAVKGDVTTLAWIRDRIPFDHAAGGRIDDRLRHLRSVADAGELEVAAVQAARLHAILAGLAPRP